MVSPRTLCLFEFGVVKLPFSVTHNHQWPACLCCNLLLDVPFVSALPLPARLPPPDLLLLCHSNIIGECLSLHHTLLQRALPVRHFFVDLLCQVLLHNRLFGGLPLVPFFLDPCLFVHLGLGFILRASFSLLCALAYVLMQLFGKATLLRLPSVDLPQGVFPLLLLFLQLVEVHTLMLRVFSSLLTLELNAHCLLSLVVLHTTLYLSTHPFAVLRAFLLFLFQFILQPLCLSSLFIPLCVLVPQALLAPALELFVAEALFLSKGITLLLFHPCGFLPPQFTLCTFLVCVLLFTLYGLCLENLLLSYL
eukprot:Hpha_TRINITY_DN16880_c1_g1::TRINITY_DN16880_c1_g1_i14::g.148786::m.148786